MWNPLFRASLAGGVFFGGLYLGNQLTKKYFVKPLPQQGPLAKGASIQEKIDDVRERYSRMAPQYDELLDKVEKDYNGFALRSALIRNAEGDVLEIGTGSSRNLVDYSLPKVRTLTLTDYTEDMLNTAIAKHMDMWNIAKVPGVLVSGDKGDKALLRAAHTISMFPSTVQDKYFTLRTLNPLSNVAIEDTEEQPTPSVEGYGFLWQKRVVRGNTLPVAFIKADSHDLSTFSDNSFDTVVDTFGLCSYEDPVKVLKEMQRVCKDNGKILLLEHGKGDGLLINAVISFTNDSHQKQWGCNRGKDIEKIVKDSGLIVLDKHREHEGTTYTFVGKPQKK